MLNKILNLILVIFLVFFISNICYATNDVLMDLNDNADNDDTIYTPSTQDDSTLSSQDTSSEVSLTNDYDDSDGELSITNIINIIFIVVGIVIILLGIAIIIKLQ